jgi:hypothetical protein
MPVLKAAAAGLALFLFCSAAWADTVKFIAALGPDSPGANKGSGTANLSVDTATKTLTYTIEYSGLSAPPVMAAFLSPPTTQKGQPGTVPINLPPGAAAPIQGTMTLTDAQIAGLKSGQWLLLIGSQQGPEIGGEVKPTK